MDWIWIGFIVFILSMLAIDLGVVNRKAHEIKPKEAFMMWGFWISLAIAFNVLVYIWFGSEQALMFTTGYIMELALSVDNMFVFVLVFTYFCVPKECQHKVLFWGVLGALVMRAIFIFAGIAIIERFEWVIYIFGAFLIITAFKMVHGGDKEVEPENNPVVRLFRRFFPVEDRFHGSKFFIRSAKGTLVATPLFVTLIFVETTDLVFALDSIPAIIAITQIPFIVYSSNAFAILGLRSLYFVLASMMNAFVYLKYGLAVILGFVGAKMLLSEFVHIDVLVSLAVIVSVLAISVIASWSKYKDAKAQLAAYEEQVCKVRKD
ncbi:MAG: TerC family protein [Methanomassiliicoccales archaeon]|nr:MAG: TerC family protein [Methanomassiliicoccales archaeon]